MEVDAEGFGMNLGVNFATHDRAASLGKNSEVHSGSEVLARTGDHDHSCSSLVGDAVYCIGKLDPESLVHRVALFGAIEHDMSHVISNFDRNGFVRWKFECHGIRSP